MEVKKCVVCGHKCNAMVILFSNHDGEDAVMGECNFVCNECFQKVKDVLMC